MCKDDCTPSTWIIPKAATFCDKLMRVCVEYLSILRDGDETIELPPEAVDTIFESLVVPNAKKCCHPIGNLEQMNTVNTISILFCTFLRLLNVQNIIALTIKIIFTSYKNHQGYAFRARE